MLLSQTATVHDQVNIPAFTYIEMPIVWQRNCPLRINRKSMGISPVKKPIDVDALLDAVSGITQRPTISLNGG